MMSARSIRQIVIGVTMALTSACGSSSPPDAARSSVPTASHRADSSSAVTPTAGSELPDERYDVWVSNQTPLQLRLVVNGSAVQDIPGSEQIRVPASTIGPLPWDLTVEAINGTPMLAFRVEASSVGGTASPSGPFGVRGVGSRIDLACGRVDAWVGPPLLGPMRPESAPPCDPYESSAGLFDTDWIHQDVAQASTID